MFKKDTFSCATSEQTDVKKGKVTRVVNTLWLSQSDKIWRLRPPWLQAHCWPWSVSLTLTRPACMANCIVAYERITFNFYYEIIEPRPRFEPTKLPTRRKQVGRFDHSATAICLIPLCILYLDSFDAKCLKGNGYKREDNERFQFHSLQLQIKVVKNILSEIRTPQQF